MDANCTWSDESGDLRLSIDGRYVGTAPRFDHPAVEARDEIVPYSDGVFQWTRRFRATRALAPDEVRLPMDFVAEHRPTFCLIPAISYNGNPWGSGREPKGFTRDGQPWSFAWHRIAVPGATYSEGSTWAVGLFAQPPPAGVGCAASLIPEAERVRHRLIWPEEEQPVVYHARDEYTEAGYKSAWAPAAGEEFVARAYLVVAPVGQPCWGWGRMLDVAWELNEHPLKSPPAPEDLWAWGVEFVSRDLWAQEGIFSGISVGMLLDNGRWKQRQYYRYEAGWAGQNIMLGRALLLDYKRRGDESSLKKGLATLDCWAEHTPLRNGLIRCVFDPLLGYRERPEVQDACNLGGAALNFLEAEQVARQCGHQRPDYGELALGICRFAVDQQHSDGKLGKAWHNDGRSADPDGTIGCFLVPPLITAYRLTRDRVYLTAAERAYEFYADGLRRDGFTTAGALDTHCIDKESAGPLLMAGLQLHEITGRPEYLDAAERAAYYLSSWQWHYSVPFPRGTPLAEMGYDTFGGTSVSTQHHHLDPWAIWFVPDLLELARRTGRDIWRHRGLAAWANGAMGVSDGSLVVAGALVPRGGQCEGFFHTRWLDSGGVSVWLVGWPTAFRLQTLARLRDWSALRI
jgi:hypothetical protein